MNSDSIDNRDFLIRNVLQLAHGEESDEAREKMSVLRHDKTDHPIIYIGYNTCGIAAGATAVSEQIKQYISQNNIQAEIIHTGCIGLCSSEPVVDIQLPGKARLSFEKADISSVNYILDSVFSHIVPTEQLLGQYKNKMLEPWENIPYIEQHPYFSLQSRNVLKNCGISDPGSIEEYISLGGYRSFLKTIRFYTGENVCKIVENAELRGRGGAGFPTAEKWKTAISAPANQKYMVCNAVESDPGSFISRSIMESDPHRVIEGAAIAAYSIGASKVYIYLQSQHSVAFERISAAVEQARSYGIIGENIFHSGYNLYFILRKSPVAMINGEETALINSLEGKRAIPRNRPPYPAQSGLFNKPTVVNNVETLANIPSIIENGPEWFKSTGTEKSRGTKIFTLTGQTWHKGIIEVPLGTRLRDIIYKTGGGINKNKGFKAVQAGGPSGGWFDENMLDTALDFEHLNNENSFMGSGGLVVYDDQSCMVHEVEYITAMLENESCGKCIPCREGTKRMAEILRMVSKRPKNESSHQTLERFKGMMEIEKLATVIRDTSLCGFGKSSPNAVISTLNLFRSEFEEHIFERTCRAGICTRLRLFYINTENCTGCGLCIKKCPENAIIGSLKQPHFIIEQKCTGCGNCYDICKFSAIIST